MISIIYMKWFSVIEVKKHYRLLKIYTIYLMISQAILSVSTVELIHGKLKSAQIIDHHYVLIVMILVVIKFAVRALFTMEAA